MSVPTANYAFSCFDLSSSSFANASFNNMRESLMLKIKSARQATAANQVIDPRQINSMIMIREMSTRTSVGPNNPESIEYLPVILYLIRVVMISQP